MQKVRVYQLAKELKVQSALILELLDRLGQDVKSDLSVLDLDTADLVRERVTTALEAEKKRLAEEQEREKLLAEAEAQLQAEQELARVATEEPAEEAEEPAEKVPLAAEPAAEEVPAARPPAPAPAKPAAPPPAAPTPVAARAADAAGPAPVPGVRKPRVFPARRIPTTPLPTRTKPVPPRPAPAAPGRPAPAAGLPGRGAPPPKKRRKKEKVREVVAPAAARPKQELPPVPEQITLSEGVTVKELAEKLNRKSKDVIAKLIGRGVLATINQPLEPATAIDVAQEFGSTASIISFEEEAQQAASAATATAPEQPVLGEVEAEPSGDLLPRPPVVTVMGHVDHGKTSLLDAFRATSVVDSEAGGITQHIGAYQIEENGRSITFLDTPGHEAFTLMRARGARATDIVVLVVAADDGVKPQTLEAIDHARAADVPIVVAINKIDKPGANADRVRQQLADHELLVEDYGGDVVSCEVSAKKRTNLDELLEMILLVADMKELRADPNKPAAGVVLEARLDRARGVLATVLVQEGKLKTGDPFIAGSAYGKVRAMVDEHRAKISEAGPSTPVEVMGFASEPTAGDVFQAVAEEAKARQIAAFRQEKVRAEQQKVSARRTLESLAHDIASGETKELPVLLKADTQGSIEALQKALADMPSEKVRVNVLRASIGAITQADVYLAAASNAIVVGFSVRPDKAASDVAKDENVELRMYTVIYDLIDDIKNAMLGLLEPTLEEKVLGQAEVRQLFRVPKIGVVAGCYITDGKVTRNSELRLLRDNVVVFTGKVGSLRRFKDDVGEVKQGYECGIGIANYNDLKEGDVIESFVMEKVAQKSL
jgi:translation initiation factor IF-2